MPSVTVPDGQRVQCEIEVYTSAGAVYRMTSPVNEFFCGGCGKTLTGEQVSGAMGPDNPYDEALEGSPLCANCELHNGTPYETIRRTFKFVDDTPVAPVHICAVLGCKTSTFQSIRSRYRVAASTVSGGTPVEFTIVTPLCLEHVKQLQLFARTHPIATIDAEFDDPPPETTVEDPSHD